MPHTLTDRQQNIGLLSLSKVQSLSWVTQLHKTDKSVSREKQITILSRQPHCYLLNQLRIPDFRFYQTSSPARKTCQHQFKHWEDLSLRWNESESRFLSQCSIWCFFAPCILLKSHWSTRKLLNALSSFFSSCVLGMPSFQKSAVFFNIVQKAFDPPPLLFEHLSYFAGGVF